MTFLQAIWRSVGRKPRQAIGELEPASREGSALSVAALTATAPAVEISANDPLFVYLQAAPGVVEIDRLELDSGALRELREAGIRIVVPLVAQGELIGAIYLGPRLSDQEYSSDDRKLLATLAAQAAPAIRVAQLVREQAIEIQARERLEQEMRVAALIQQQFLPHELPALPDWQVAAYYAPARAVGGDFYDFIQLPEDRIGIVVGDVTGKGVPAALLMARTQSVLRSEAPRLVSPSKVLGSANGILKPEMPAHMFVTCLYMVLEPATGRVVYANAGHNLPIVRTGDGVIELRATGMPLGLMPDQTYDEKEAVVGPGQNLLLYSDGIDEAHDPSGEMFGVPRLRELLATKLPGGEVIDRLLEELYAFVGRGWDQEDDITLLALERTGGAEETSARLEPGSTAGAEIGRDRGRILLSLSLPSAQGNERVAMDQVAEAVAVLGLPEARLERLKTAVSEATMNAIQYGSKDDAEVPVEIEVALTARDLIVRITDRGRSGTIPDVEEPNIEAKLAGEQKPRGWGLFLIRHMVDAMDVVSDGSRQTVILTLHLEGAANDSQAV